MSAIRLLSRDESGDAPTTAQVRIASALRMTSSTAPEGNVRRLRVAVSISRRLVVLATGLVAARPGLLSAVRAGAHDWTPVGDQTVIATRGIRLPHSACARSGT